MKRINRNEIMVRFLNLKDQICEAQNDFAFYDTVSGTICSFGEQGEQVFSSIGEFQYAYGKEQEGTTSPLSRFVSLIPEGYFENKINWTEPKPPTEGISHYDHTICETPLGQALIEWKSWKESDSYSLTIGNDYVGEGWDLDDAKRLAKEWLTKKHNELSVLLGV